MNAVGQFLVNAVDHGQLSIEHPVGMDLVDGIEDVLCRDIRVIDQSPIIIEDAAEHRERAGSRLVYDVSILCAGASKGTV